MELLFGTLVLKEMLHYKFFNKLSSFVQRKKYSGALVTDISWYENYILNELTVDELKIWIRNVFSYNNPSGKSYYVPIEIENIPRNKMIKWVSYNLYYKSLWQLTVEELDYSSNVLQKIETKIDIKFFDISEPNIYFLKFGNNKVECTYRPSIVCSILELLKDTCYFSLYMFDFDKYKIKNTNIVYFHYYNPKNTKTIIFIHGFGFGIEPYLYYILRLKKQYNLIVPILPNISNMEYARTMKEITYDNLFPEYNTWRKAFRSIMIKHNIEKCSIIAHSFGTIITSLILKDNWINQRIDRKVLIEPVCFIDKSYKIYRYINEPQEGNYGVISKVFNEFIYKDVFLRYATQRFLYGPEFWITDYDSLSNNTLIVVSEQDQVVPSDEIYNKMRKHNIECIYVKGAYHADMFMSDEFESVFDHVDNFIQIQS